ncbi:MAG TPA: TetR/AcrR family transcriptional regulator, partial [Paludibacteraceae bacterium]|nr:TetR/AcrR family transcriptional regulator [Paludibacteraceae bacterium]HQF50933.1 TetR/AcrR family transcriptional regulator [Paludibacteraceae bacterium]HQJ89715.1 TetR/AcrR family transcriptional regulator [Paludibacteraceae bacterium]
TISMEASASSTHSNQHRPTETDIRARVIEHAAKKFAANGIKSITMDEIAEQLGMSKRTLYELFKDKKNW